MTNLATNIKSLPGFFNQLATKVDPKSPICSMLGINHVVDSASAFKRKHYAESMTELMKAALKWTMVGAVCIGMHKWSTRPVVYVNELHAKALNDLSGSEHSFKTSSADAKTLLNHYLSQQSHYKHWPQDGKDYVAKCLESNSAVASFSTRYLLEQSAADSGLVNAVLKTCGAASTTTASCWTAQKTLSEKSKDLSALTSKIVGACKKNQNALCQQARNGVIDTAMQNQAWDKLINDCINTKTPAATCTPALSSLETQLATANTEKAWEMAKKINNQCRGKQLPVCKKAHNIILSQTIQRRTWKELLRDVDQQSKRPTEDTINLIEKLVKTFEHEINQANGIATTQEENNRIYNELKYPAYQTGELSKISIGLALADACIQVPSTTSVQNVQAIIAFFEGYKKSLLQQVEAAKKKIEDEKAKKLHRSYDDYDDYYDTYSYYHHDTSTAAEVTELLEAKIKALNEKLTGEKFLASKKKTPKAFNEPENAPQANSLPIQLPKKEYKFSCNDNNRWQIWALGRQGSLLATAIFDGGNVKEDEVDWESCGL